MTRQVTPWQVLAQRDFGLFWTSLLFSAVGSEIAAVAVAWQVYEITNSPFQLGLTGLFRFSFIRENSAILALMSMDTCVNFSAPIDQ